MKSESCLFTCYFPKKEGVERKNLTNLVTIMFINSLSEVQGPIQVETSLFVFVFEQTLISIQMLTVLLNLFFVTTRTGATSFLQRRTGTEVKSTKPPRYLLTRIVHKQQLLLDWLLTLPKQNSFLMAVILVLRFVCR